MSTKTETHTIRNRNARPRSRAILISLLGAGLLAAPAVASGSGGKADAVQRWQGHGAVFDRQRKKLGDYELKMTRSRQANGRLSSVVEVQLPGGKTRRIACTIDEEGRGQSWRADCGEHGRGGGACFGEGLCIDYQQDRSGRARSTTVIFDGRGKMRLMRTELQDGKAVRFYRERLTRVGAQGR